MLGWELQKKEAYLICYAADVEMFSLKPHPAELVFTGHYMK